MRMWSHVCISVEFVHVYTRVRACVRAYMRICISVITPVSSSWAECNALPPFPLLLPSAPSSAHEDRGARACAREASKESETGARLTRPPRRGRRQRGLRSSADSGPRNEWPTKSAVEWILREARLRQPPPPPLTGSDSASGPKDRCPRQRRDWGS